MSETSQSTRLLANGPVTRAAPIVGSRWVDRCLLAYAALVPVIAFRVGPYGVGAVDVVLPFGIGAILSRRPSFSLPGAMLKLFLASSLASTICILFFGNIPGLGLHNLVALLRNFGIYIPFALILGAPYCIDAIGRRFVAMFIKSGCLACVTGIVLFILHIQLRVEQQTLFYGNGYGEALRAGGLLGNSADFGHLAGVLGSSAICFGVLWRWRPLPVIAVVAVAGLAAWDSSSRSAVLFMVITLVIMLPELLRGQRLAITCLLLPLGIGVVAAAASSGLSYTTLVALRRLDVFNLSGNSTFFQESTRQDTWGQMFRLIVEHPLTGIGYDMTDTVLQRIGDNSFITILTETGVVSGVFYIAFWVVLLVRLGKANDRKIRRTGLAFGLGELSEMLTVDTHRMWYATPIALAMIALFIRMDWEARASSAITVPRADQTYLPTDTYVD